MALVPMKKTGQELDEHLSETQDLLHLVLVHLDHYDYDDMEVTIQRARTALTIVDARLNELGDQLQDLDRKEARAS